MRYLDPKNDIPFKKIFGEHPDLLMSFLNELLPIQKPIVSIEYLTPELFPSKEGSKNSIVDVRCKDQIGRQFIVEMQFAWTPMFKYRVLLNASKAFVNQLPKGGMYHLLEPVFSLCLVNTVYDNGSEEYFHHYKIVEQNNSHQIIEGLEFVFIELPKFKAKTFTDKKVKSLWLRFMSEIDGGQQVLPQEFFDNKNINKAVQILQESAYSDIELESYYNVWDSRGIEDLLYRGAMEQGIEKGMEKGLERGKKIQLIETIRIMLVQKLSFEQIAIISGFTLQELEHFIQENNI